MTNTKDEDGRRVRPFSDFLAEHNSGLGHRLAGEALQDVAASVVDTGKKGSMTVTVSVEPLKGSEGTLMTTVVVNTKLPIAPPKPAVFYVADDGALTRSDPNQPAFEGLKEASAAPEVRDAPSAPTLRTAGGDR